jgi:hypothetical protein
MEFPEKISKISGSEPIPGKIYSKDNFVMTIWSKVNILKKRRLGEIVDPDASLKVKNQVLFNYN